MTNGPRRARDRRGEGKRRGGEIKVPPAAGAASVFGALRLFVRPVIRISRVRLWGWGGGTVGLGADYRRQGLLSECRGIKIRAAALYTALFTMEIRI